MQILKSKCFSANIIFLLYYFMEIVSIVPESYEASNVEIIEIRSY